MDKKKAELISRTLVEAEAKGFSDFHIDEYDANFIVRKKWLENSKATLNEVVEYFGDVRENVLGIGLSLVSGKTAIGINFHNEKDLIAELDSSPPSIYIFQEMFDFNANGWVELNKKEINISDLAEYFFEFQSPHDNEFRRSFFLIRKVAPPK